MPNIGFDKIVAKALLRKEAELAKEGKIDAGWEKKIEELSRLCEKASVKTHIAFIGTEILAKALNLNVDLYAIKPEHADASANSFSARTLCHEVLVPLAAELGIHIGATGREPLNNQPYFRMTRFGDDTPVHPRSRPAFEYTKKLVRDLSEINSKEVALRPLRAFIVVRQRYQMRYVPEEGGVKVRPEALGDLISAFVRENSENGKRAQAVVAGLLDAFAGKNRVISGRINDPSRNYPGDVCILPANREKTVLEPLGLHTGGAVTSGGWGIAHQEILGSEDATPPLYAITVSAEKAFEVRDKSVTKDDIQIFAKKCVDMGVREAAVVMISENQGAIDANALATWASGYGIGLTLFSNWRDFTDQVLFWSDFPKPDAVLKAVGHIEERLIAIEASPTAISSWRSLTREK